MFMVYRRVSSSVVLDRATRTFVCAIVVVSVLLGVPLALHLNLPAKHPTKNSQSILEVAGSLSPRSTPPSGSLLVNSSYALVTTHEDPWPPPCPAPTDYPPPWAEYSFSAHAANGTSPYSYSWNFGDKTPNATGPQAEHWFDEWNGTFRVIVSATDSTGRWGEGAMWLTFAESNAVRAHPLWPDQYVCLGSVQAYNWELAIAGSMVPIAIFEVIMLRRRRRHHREGMADKPGSP